jgi:hypothetical protein
MKKGIAERKGRAAGQRDPLGCWCGRVVAHVRVQEGRHGIPQPVFLQLIAADNGLIKP